VPFTVTIPKDKIQAEQTIKLLLDEGKRKRAPQAIRWWICRHYMRGVRNFKNLNYLDGTIQISYHDEKGVLNFLYEDIISKCQAQLGRLQGLDLTPVVRKEGISLDGMRKASIGQVVLDSVFPAPKIVDIQAETMSTLLLYGTLALVPWVIGEDSIGIDVIPPWEILPIPMEIDTPHKARGLVRRKLVPIDWIQDRPNTPDKRNKIYKEMEKVKMPVGYIPPEGKSRFQGSVSVGISDVTAHTQLETTGVGGSSRQPDKTKVEVVEAAEIWTKTADNYWAEYLLYAGGKLLQREDFTGMKKQFPPQVISDVQIGNFWGRSFVDTLIPLNCEMEGAIARQFQNVKDWDLYGILMEPTTSGMPARVMRGKDGIKRARFEPDPITPDIKPYTIQPNQTGLLPAKVIEMGAQLQSNIANQPTELMSGGAPGRVDSSAGLGFLFETSNVPLTPTAKAVAQAFSNCYRVTLDITRDRWGDEKVLDITHLDDSIAGVTIDPSTGRMKLTENAIPHPDEVIVSVSSAVPRSKEQRKLELKDALKTGIITATEYRIKARTESLDLPVGNEIEWQNYRRAMLENLVLFGDGRQPGQITYSDGDLHMVHLMVLDAFMARPEFYLASSPVRAIFQKHREEHLAGTGAFPEGMPYGEEAAEESVSQADEYQRLMERQPTANMEGGGY